MVTYLSEGGRGSILCRAAASTCDFSGFRSRAFWGWGVVIHSAVRKGVSPSWCDYPIIQSECCDIVPGVSAIPRWKILFLHGTFVYLFFGMLDLSIFSVGLIECTRPLIDILAFSMSENGFISLDSVHVSA